MVIAGRSTDTALTLAPMIHRFGWKPDDWDKLAAGTIAGHIIECGAQCTGGNCQVDWQTIPDMANIGYPIVEAEPDGTFTVTKHPGTGGRVHSDTVKEQLLYELGDPKHYITPDCVADFTTIQLADTGPDRVRVTGIRGGPRPPTLKLSISYADGWKAIGTLVYSWPQALEKARAADRIVRERLAQLGLTFDEIYTEFFGVNACHGPAAPPNPDPPEVQLRIGVRGQDRKAVDRFTRELIPAGAERPAGRDRLRRRPAAGARNRGLLVGADPARRNSDARGGEFNEESALAPSPTPAPATKATRPTSASSLQARALSGDPARSDSRTRERIFRRPGQRQGRALRVAQPRRDQFAAARSSGRRRHVLAAHRRAGQNLRRRAAAHGNRGQRERNWRSSETAVKTWCPFCRR